MRLLCCIWTGVNIFGVYVCSFILATIFLIISPFFQIGTMMNKVIMKLISVEESQCYKELVNWAHMVVSSHK